MLNIHIILSILVGTCAERWGRSKKKYGFLSLFFSPLLVGIVLLIYGKNKELSKKCPHCAEYIKKEATICKFCGKEQAIEKSYGLDIPNKSDTNENASKEFYEEQKIYPMTKHSIQPITRSKKEESSIWLSIIISIGVVVIIILGTIFGQK